MIVLIIGYIIPFLKRARKLMRAPGLNKMLTVPHSEDEAWVEELIINLLHNFLATHVSEQAVPEVVTFGVHSDTVATRVVFLTPTATGSTVMNV